SVAVGFGSVEEAGRHQQVARDLMADLKDQIRRHDGRHESDLYFRVSKFRFWDRQREVAHRGYTRAACDGGAIHSSDGRLGKVIDRTEQVRHGLRILYVLLL